MAANASQILIGGMTPRPCTTCRAPTTAATTGPANSVSSDTTMSGRHRVARGTRSAARASADTAKYRIQSASAPPPASRWVGPTGQAATPRRSTWGAKSDPVATATSWPAARAARTSGSTVLTCPYIGQAVNKDAHQSLLDTRQHTPQTAARCSRARSSPARPASPVWMISSGSPSTSAAAWACSVSSECGAGRARPRGDNAGSTRRAGRETGPGPARRRRYG